MATETSSTAAGAVNPPPSSTPRYTPRGVFNNSGTSAGTSGTSGGSTTSTSQTTLNPSTGTGGGGVTPNDSTITLTAGTGLLGGGDFTTNQSFDEGITFSLPNVITPSTYGSASNVIQSITVDEQGRVTNVTTSGTPPNPFNDNLSAGSDAPPSQAASESDRMETITLRVANGYTIDEVTTSAGGIIDDNDVGTPTGLGTNEVTIPVTIQGTSSSSDPIGGGTVTATTTTIETDTMRERVETVTPLRTSTFLPYYTVIFDNNNRQTTTSIQLSSFVASNAAITHGGRLLISNPFGAGRPDKYAYFALQTNDGVDGSGTARNYMFSFGSFGVDIDVFTTRTMFGRTYNIYEFPTRGDVDLTVTF